MTLSPLRRTATLLAAGCASLLLFTACDRKPADPMPPSTTTTPPATTTPAPAPMPPASAASQ